jgi:CspA family cold shock protein
MQKAASAAPDRNGRNLPKWHNPVRLQPQKPVKPLINRGYGRFPETCQNFVACFFKKMLARIGSRAFMPVTGQMWQSLRRRSFPVRDYSTRLPRRAKAEPSGIDHRAHQDYWEKGYIMATKGTVKFFNQDKGFGFITPEGGAKDVFVHISALQASGIQSLREGQQVTFDTEPDRMGKGPKAVNISAF